MSSHIEDLPFWISLSHTIHVWYIIPTFHHQNTSKYPNHLPPETVSTFKCINKNHRLSDSRKRFRLEVYWTCAWSLDSRKFEGYGPCWSLSSTSRTQFYPSIDAILPRRRERLLSCSEISRKLLKIAIVLLVGIHVFTGQYWKVVACDEVMVCLHASVRIHEVDFPADTFKFVYWDSFIRFI